MLLGDQNNLEKLPTHEIKRYGSESLLDVAILAKRKQVLEAAKQVNPMRWSGDVRNCKPAGPVTLNPDKPENVEVKNAA